MYKSPIEIFYGQMQTQIENDVIKAVQNIGVNVDQYELIRALKYDREQYEKGYADGKADAMADLVKCKDCKHWCDSWVAPDCKHVHGECHMEDADDVIVGRWGDDFCSYGERKDND